jgi:hypothetical protein
MGLATFRGALLSANPASLRLALRKPQALKSYLSTCSRAYRHAPGLGLPAEPFEYLEKQQWNAPSDRFEPALKLSYDSVPSGTRRCAWAPSPSC